VAEYWQTTLDRGKGFINLIRGEDIVEGGEGNLEIDVLEIRGRRHVSRRMRHGRGMAVVVAEGSRTVTVMRDVFEHDARRCES